ncbi:MAG: PAS domain-containing protein, partial [Deferrisomatales bacterium]
MAYPEPEASAAPSSPWLNLGLVLGAVFGVEAAIMVWLGDDSGVPLPLRALLDASLLAAAVLPVVYLAVLRPLRRALADQARAHDREAAERLRAEAQYRLLFEESPFLCAVTRNVGGAALVEDCNRPFHEALGYPRDQVVGRPLAEFYAPASRLALAGGGYQRALEGRFAEEERVLLTRAGAELTTILRARPILGPGGSAVGTLAVYVDITARRRTEEALRQSEERLDLAVAGTGAGLWDLRFPPGAEPGG